MTDKLTQRAINSAEADAQAFGLTGAFNRLQFVKDLVNDPATSVFSKDVVRWLVQALEDERTKGSRLTTERQQLRDKLTAATNAPVMPKGKAIVKLSKVIASQADCIAEIDAVIEKDLWSDVDPYAALRNALEGWQKNYTEIIKAANDGD